MKTISHLHKAAPSIKKERSSIIKKPRNTNPQSLSNVYQSLHKDERFHSLVRYLSDIITLFDNDMKLIYHTPSLERILGYQHEELIGKDFDNLRIIHKADIGKFKKFIKDTQRKKNEEVIAIFRLTHKNGSSQYFEAVGVNCLAKPGIRGIITTFRDITERRELEKRKDDFITIASHELKTPISTIKTFAQILEKRLQKSNAKKNMYFITNINKQLLKLTDLINDLLDVTRIESGKLTFRKKLFSLDDLIKRCVIDFQYLTDTHQVLKKGELNEKIYGDEDRIAQVLINLITNAIKYSPKGEKVIVQISSEENKVIVGVQDFGRGIAKKDQKKIFDRFYRTDETHSAGGFGLGLYIAYEIITRHKGTLWVVSKWGKGSTFFFSLPIKEVNYNN